MTQERVNNWAGQHQLSITEAGRPDHTIALDSTVTVGRDAENDIVLAVATVSRQHALLLGDAVGMLLLDLDSTNGTLVNGVLARPDEPVRLVDGDMIRFGQVVARYSAPPPDAAPFQDSDAPLEQAHSNCRQAPRLTAMWMATAQGLCMHWAPGSRAAAAWLPDSKRSIHLQTAIAWSLA
jgi:predicted component of type VI protein secretion system